MAESKPNEEIFFHKFFPLTKDRIKVECKGCNKIFHSARMYNVHLKNKHYNNNLNDRVTELREKVGNRPHGYPQIDL